MDSAEPDRPVLDERYHADLIKHAMQHGWQTSGCRACLLGSQLLENANRD
jgi:hypothetical protein